MIRRVLAWLLLGREFIDQLDRLEQAVDLRDNEILSLKEQRDTFRDALQALRWEKIAHGAEAKLYIETMKGRPGA